MTDSATGKRAAQWRRQLRRLRPTRALVGRIDTRVDRTMRQQESLQTRLERQAATIARQNTQLERLARQLEKLQGTVSQLRERSRPLEEEANTRFVQHSRMSVQLGMLERRMGELEERLATGTVTGDDAAREEARGIVELVRREHEQVRIRLQLVSHYEERLRRIEAAIESIAEAGDVRRMV
jgi:chromosome segregation ATPase